MDSSDAVRIPHVPLPAHRDRWRAEPEPADAAEGAERDSS